MAIAIGGAPLYDRVRFQGPILGLSTGRALVTRLSLARFMVFIDDPNFGLVAWCPFLVITTLVVALLFMYSFAQTPNLNSGGTFGMARYALWFIPLAIPVLAEGQAAFGAKFDRWVIPPAIIGMVWSVALAHPRLPESYRIPLG